MAFFALIPPASKAGVRDLSSNEGHKGEYQNSKEKDVVQIGGSKYTVGSPDDAEEELGAAGDPLLVRGRRKYDAAERDQIKPDELGGGKNWSAIYYLRVSKWGSRSLCPLIFNFLFMILLEVCTYYNDTWTRGTTPPGSPCTASSPCSSASPSPPRFPLGPRASSSVGSCAPDQQRLDL